MSRFSGSNNIHYTMPPMMNDGRNYSNLQPDSIINDKIKQQQGITSNWDYRRYLQKNAQDIMKYNYTDFVNDSGNNPNTYVNTQPSPNSPFVFQSIHDTRKPSPQNNTDLKQWYLTREQLNARMISPSIPTNF